MAQAERERAEKLAKEKAHVYLSLMKRGRYSQVAALEQVCFSELWTGAGSAGKLCKAGVSVCDSYRRWSGCRIRRAVSGVG